MALSASVSSRT